MSEMVLPVRIERNFLEGQVALVTGAARGIGREVAEMLAWHGATVVVNDLEGEAEAAASEIGPGAIGVGLDLLVEDGPDRLVAETLSRAGRLDIVVNNAGYTWDGIAHRMSDRQFQAMIDIHLVVPFRVLRAASTHLREAAKADLAAGRDVFRKVVNVTSTSGVMGNPGQANYAAGKAGVVGLTKTLAREWGPLHINVNAVAFGFVATRLTAAEETETIELGGEQIALGIPAEVREAVSESIPLGRFASPTEAAGGVVFLCSPWSNFVHGQVLNVTGGQLTGMAG